MGGSVCPRCGCTVALHEGRPFVSASGAVQLWHATCWMVRDTGPADEAPVALPPAARPTPPIRAITAGVCAAMFAAAAYLGRAPLPPSSLAAISIDPHEVPNFPAQLTEREAPPPSQDLTERFPVPDTDGMPLDEIYPSLLDWMHPVTATDNVLSTQSTGMFGADRDGVRRSECGQGHCGIDLGGPIGRPVVAVADGVVVRVEHSELGRDGRSGRYVRIEHPDGTLTAYMHLDTIEAGLEVGDRVDGGQQIGTLGATAINHAAPHVHFSLEVPAIPGTHGDTVNTRYVDPAPFLVRATIVPAADRRRAEKPAF